MNLDAQVAYFLLKCRVLLVSLGDDQSIDAFTDNCFATGIMVEVNGVTIRAMQAGIGDSLDTKLMHNPGPVRSHVKLQILTQRLTIYTKLYRAAFKSELFSHTKPNPVASPIGNDYPVPRIGLTAQDLPCVEEVDVG